MTDNVKFREMLLDCIEKVRKGEMKATDAQAIAALSGNVLQSAKLELDYLKHAKRVSSAYFDPMQRQMIEAEAEKRAKELLELNTDEESNLKAA